MSPVMPKSAQAAVAPPFPASRPSCPWLECGGSNPHQADETLRYPFISIYNVDLPMKNGDFPVRYVNVDQTGHFQHLDNGPLSSMIRGKTGQRVYPHIVMGSKHLLNLFINIFMVFCSIFG